MQQWQNDDYTRLWSRIVGHSCAPRARYVFDSGLAMPKTMLDSLPVALRIKAAAGNLSNEFVVDFERRLAR